MNILVTGGAGFIGSHLVDVLLKGGHKVVVADDMSGGSESNLAKGAVFSKFDCRDAGQMDQLFTTFKPEIVYHLACNAAENKAQFSPIDITSRNYDAFIKVLTPFIKYGGKRFIFTSSIAVYGALQTPFKETDKPEPEDLYGITKLAAEQTLKVMSEVHGFEYVIARPHNVYGPRQNMRDPYRNVVTIWMNAFLRKMNYFIYGDGNQKRCFSYIDDVAKALYRCGFELVSGMTFNIGSDKTYTLNQLAEYMQIYTFRKPKYLPERPQEVKDAIADHTLAKKYLCYTDSLSLEQGLANTWEYCKAKGPQEPIYTTIEIPSEKLPSNWIQT
jgi:UDP-glucose 4-epimerase